VQAAIAIGLEVDRCDLIQFKMAKADVADRHALQTERSAEFGDEGVPFFGVRHKEVSVFSEEGFDHRGHRAHRGGVVGVV
jgi:hypothetical protein